jgi:hypothetical protein
MKTNALDFLLLSPKNAHGSQALKKKEKERKKERKKIILQGNYIKNILT